jgi:hypothetical protein
MSAPDAAVSYLPPRVSMIPVAAGLRSPHRSIRIVFRKAVIPAISWFAQRLLAVNAMVILGTSSRTAQLRADLDIALTQRL